MRGMVILMFNKIRSSTRMLIIFTMPLFMAFICVIIVLQAFRYNDNVSQKNIYTQKIKALNNDLKNNMDKLNNKFTEDNLEKIFSINDLYTYANRFWVYELLINSDRKSVV